MSGPREPGPRKAPDPKSQPITATTFKCLLVALEKVYPGKVRRAVDVMPVAINKTIDNEKDALETICRVEERHGPTLEEGRCVRCNGRIEPDPREPFLTLTGHGPSCRGAGRPAKVKKEKRRPLKSD